MSDFLESSNYRLWIFLSSEVDACKRASICRAATLGDSSKGNRNDAMPVYTTIKASQSIDPIKELALKEDPYKHAEVSAIIEDEEYLTRHFCHQIELCMSSRETRTFGFTSCENKHWRVCATAIVYFRRFYLNNSMSVHDPRVILLGCILLAGKTEEARVERTHELLQLNPCCTVQTLLSAELFVIQAINFNTKVFHPQNMCQTLLSDVKRKHSAKSNMRAKDAVSIEPRVFDQWLSSAEKVLGVLQVTRACLIYSSFNIAFAALYLTEASAHSANLVEVKKDIVSITIKSESDTNRVHSSTFLKYFAMQFGEDQCRLSLACAAGIISLIEEGQNCMDGVESPFVHAAMKRLKRRAVWGALAAAPAGQAQEDSHGEAPETVFSSAQHSPPKKIKRG